MSKRKQIEGWLIKEWWRDEVCRQHTFYKNTQLFSCSKEARILDDVLHIVSSHLSIRFVVDDRTDILLIEDREQV